MYNIGKEQFGTEVRKIKVVIEQNRKKIRECQQGNLNSSEDQFNYWEKVGIILLTDDIRSGLSRLYGEPKK